MIWGQELNLTVGEGWLVLGCKDSYWSCCYPQFLDPEDREGRGEWKTTLVFKGSQQARSKGRAKRWCTPLSPFDGFFMFNLWWHPAGHQDHSSSPHWHVCSWISSPTIAFLKGVPWGLRTDHLPQFSHRSVDGLSPTAAGCPWWRRCAHWGQCWAVGFSAAPREHETALWCSLWFLHLRTQWQIFTVWVEIKCNNAKELWLYV